MRSNPNPDSNAYGNSAIKRDTDTDSYTYGNSNTYSNANADSPLG
jgi:hypothetical protein